MADIADQAQAQIEAELESNLAAARRYTPPARTHCTDCGEKLEDHRRQWGRCIECQQERERMQRVMAVGV